jgi:hypothetical protein
MNRLPLFLFLLLALTSLAHAAPPLATAPVGLESRVFYRSQDPGLLPTPANDKADLTLRIASHATDSANPAWTIYDLRAIAAIPGEYDLRAYLRHADNSPITDGEPIVIRATSSLAANQNGDLFPIATGAPKKIGGYRLGLIILTALWLTPLVWLAIRRFRRGKPAALAAPTGPPTLADQLRPLVESAMAGSLDDPRRARLERLLIAHWRERLSLANRSHAESIGILRLHREAGPLLSHLEVWLHRPEGAASAPQVDLQALLAPYRTAAPINDPDGPPAGGHARNHRPEEVHA